MVAVCPVVIAKKDILSSVPFPQAVQLFPIPKVGE
jgi:hypothetical protein